MAKALPRNSVQFSGFEQGLELNPREVVTLLPRAILVVSLGLYPELVLSYLRAPVADLLTGVLP